MKMNSQTTGWFILLALIKNFPNSHGFFKLSSSRLAANEGSCAEIQCIVTNIVDDDGSHWFWMKNNAWDEDKKQYNATIIYSSDNSERPVNPDFATRVKYVGSPSSSWKLNTRSSKFCSILICDLKITDSGSYAFRFIGKPGKWVTQTLDLRVIRNPCPITFEKPPVVKESEMITLTCSTLSSCYINLQIRALTQSYQTPPSNSQQTEEKQKITRVSFRASWRDDGKEFTCQTQSNRDTYLIRRISVTVEYTPKDTLAKISHTNIVEGESVTLTCSAKGRPDPTFTWIQNEKTLFFMAEWRIQSITDSQSGKYYCAALNIHGSTKSRLPVDINVKYMPQVEVKMMSPASIVKQGDQMSLQCIVRRSNPPPYACTWFINGRRNGVWKYSYDKRMEPEDSGSYTCRATNTVGTGTSEPLQIQVQYRPRRTNISISKNDKRVKVNESHTLTCKADANPAPVSYSWYHYNKNEQTDSSPWKLNAMNRDYLSLERVQRTDEGCYVCKATNIISTGENSEPLCIQVLYPPTNLVLSMDTEVTEGQLITISCTVESFPPSRLMLTGTSTSNPQSPKWHFTQPENYQQSNTFQHTFTVNPTHAGFYSCNAINSVDSNKSIQKKLAVKYRPKDVTVQASPGLTVDENMLLTLCCSAQSYPGVSSFTWIKMTDGKSETIQKTQTIRINSVSPSDSGLYSCSASNEVGTGNSQQAEVKVKYAPKQPNITRAAEQQHPNGTSSVTLSCSSHSYPPVKYSWYKKIKAEESDEKVSNEQNYTVYSDLPGVYYCAAENELNHTSSDLVQLFVGSGFVTAMKFFCPFLIILLAIFLLFLIYRNRRNKSIQQGTTNTPPCFAFLGWWHCTRRRNLLNEPVMAEPSRSRDDLFPDQTQRRQPHPDSTPASKFSSVYYTVNLPGEGPSAQKSIREQGGCTEDGSSLHFGNKQNKEEKAEENILYAKVSKQKPHKKNEEYENVNADPNPVNCDTDTSEEEVELNYSQVSIEAKPGHQRAAQRDSSTSDEEETQYSEVKI